MRLRVRERRGPEVVGRRRAARPRTLGRALSCTLLMVLLPGLLAGAVGYYLLREQRPTLVRLVVDPSSLLVIAVVLAVGWLVWLGLIWAIYARTRPLGAPQVVRMTGVVTVVALCVSVTAPMAVGAKYAMVQRDLITTVFTGEDNATTPTATVANPWGGRKRVNVLLLGGDGDVGRYGIRTDSVILASIDVRNGQTILFSLPRNLQNVPFPEKSELGQLYPDGFDGTGDDAEYFLNAVYQNIPALHPGILGDSDNEGADAVKLAVTAALGLTVDYYALVNLKGFAQIVDAIGGITVNINEPVAIGGNTDAGIPPDDYLQPGPDQRLDGFKALWFSRGRYGSTDYKRMQRQRCALNAMVAEADPATLLTRYTDLAAASKELVRTDIPQRLLPAFVELAEKMKDAGMTAVGFERTEEFDPNDPDYEYVRRTVDAAVHPKPRIASAPPPTSEEPAAAPDDDPAGAEDLSGEPEGSEETGSMTRTEDDCGYHPDPEVGDPDVDPYGDPDGDPDGTGGTGDVDAGPPLRAPAYRQEPPD